MSEVEGRSERSERARALARAGGMLARRSHSRLEVERALSRSVDVEIARLVVAELEAASLLDDDRYAAELVAYRLRKGWGPHRIRFDLEQAGIERALARELVDAIDADDLRRAGVVAVGAREGAAAVRRLSARGFEGGAATSH